MTDFRKRTVWRFVGLVLLCFGILVFLSGVRLFFAPKVYWATARLRVEPDPPSTEDAREPKAKPSSYDPAFLQTEAEIIGSEGVLTNVIDKLNLKQQWGKKYGIPALKTEETMALLKRNMGVRVVSNTSLIEIHARSEQASEAAPLANALAASYREFRVRKLIRQSEAKLDALRDALGGQDREIANLQDRLTELRTKLKISSPLPADNEQAFFTSENQPYFEAKRRLEDMQPFRQALRTRMDAEKLLIGLLPKLNLVDFVETAVVDYYSFSPKGPTIVTMLIVGVVMVIIGARVRSKKVRTLDLGDDLSRADPLISKDEPHVRY